MKKKIIALATAATMLFSATTVMAQELTNTSPSGDTTVTAKVSNGAVTYVVQIPDAVDFGTLQQPEDNAVEHNVEKEFNIVVTELTGMDVTQNRLVVLMQDAENVANGQFCIKGQDNMNSDKKLEYDAVNEFGESYTTALPYANGYLVTLFKAVDESAKVKLKLDQNQLYGVELDKYAGSYMGTLSFYTKIASASDYTN